MVGIPGKSKGCHNCRRRKIKCDLEQPNCGRCIKSGRECEGYNRGAVFLNRSVKGWEKRARLEEIQPRQPTVPVIVTGSEKKKTEFRTKLDKRARPKAVKPIVKSESASPTVLHSNPDFRKQIFQSLFLQQYLPRSSRVDTGLAGAWLLEAIRLDSRSTCLEYALHALCLTRVGRISSHGDLIKRGASAYGIALRALRSALESPKYAGTDETLAACFILSIYELYESTSDSTSAHEEHMSGIERLVEYRGRCQNDNRLSRALFKNICYASMIKSLQYRKTSRLKSLVDDTEWWDIQGRLFAKGHNLGALLDDLDRYKNSGKQDLPIAASYLKRCWALDLEFQKWYAELEAESSSPIYSTTEDKEAVLFSSISNALLLLDYWALRLILSTTIDIITSQVPDSAPLPPTMRTFVEALKLAHGSVRQVELASNIMLSIPFCMRDEHGVSSSQKCLFSGRVALFALRRQSEPRLERWEKTFLDLQVRKGLMFAKDIEKKEMSEWTPHISEGK